MHQLCTIGRNEFFCVVFSVVEVTFLLLMRFYSFHLSCECETEGLPLCFSLHVKLLENESLFIITTQ